MGPNFWFHFAFFALFACASFGEEEEVELEEGFPSENEVFVLTDDNFDDFLEKNPTTLVEFYAPWCGHCKALAPELEKAAEALKSATPPVPLAKVDATENKELGERFEVRGYPTLKFWKDGAPMDYDGPREKDGIVQWVKEKSDPNYKPPPEAVLTLTNDNFQETVDKEKIILVEFYAPWCGHCKKLAPEYEKAAQKLKASTPSIPLAKVDATKEQSVVAKFGVSGYPTLKIFRKGAVFDYNGPRDAAGIAEYMIDQSKPAAKEIKSAAEIKKFMSKDDVTILGFFESETDPIFSAFKEAADARREDFSTIGYSTDLSARKEFKASVGAIGVFYPQMFWSKYEPKFKYLEKKDASREEVESFWLENCRPLVGERTAANQALRYTQRPLVLVYYTVDFGIQHREGTEYWRQKVLNVAKDFKDKLYFAVSDEESYSRELAEFGLADSGLEVNVGVFGKDGKRYPMDPEEFDEFSEENLREFLALFLKGKTKPHIKSQPIPKDDKGPVKTVVAHNFDKVVLDTSKDVLVEFYAPWCGHCKALEPVYKSLAKSLKHEENLVIAKFDAIANDPPSDFKVEGFPTIFFVPAGKNSTPMKYEGGRTQEEMTKFLKENGVVSLQKTEL